MGLKFVHLSTEDKVQRKPNCLFLHVRYEERQMQIPHATHNFTAGVVVSFMPLPVHLR
jgi:hypothetical protein